MSKTPAGKKDLSSKLAGAVRTAKTGPVAESAPGGPPRATPVPPRTPEEGKPAKPLVAPPLARQSDQAPLPSLDDPWRNLYPERIWPD